MDALVHPTQLSVWQRYLQARRLHKETSRSKNADWYRPALELDCQLHLFVEGEVIAQAFLRDSKSPLGTWTQVPAPTLEFDEASVNDYVLAIRNDHASRKVKSLGVVLHVADEFAISELANAHDRPEDFTELREALECSPQDVLEDHSISTDELSFRLFPYDGAQPGQLFGSAITISRKHQEFLRHFRTAGEDLNFPTCTSALSAPLASIMALPKLVQQLPGQPFCVFLSYSTFSVIAFFTADGNLVMLRSVRHHAGGIPPNVGTIIQTMAAALELPEPVIYVLPLGQSNGEAVVASLPCANPLDWRATGEFDGMVPLEFQAASDPAREVESGLGASMTYQELNANKWAVQDFLSASGEESEMYPSSTEMKILRIGGLGLRIGAVAVTILLGWTGVRAFSILRSEAWHLASQPPSESANARLAKEIRLYEHWNKCLADRSKAWISMELVNQLFPNPNNVIISDAALVVQPEVTREQAQASLVKKWTVNGYVNKEGLKYLTAINSTKGMSDIFDAVALRTGDDSLRMMDSSRSLVVDLVASENKRHKKPNQIAKPEDKFSYIFNLTIQQRITSEDPLAIPTESAP